MACGCEVCSSFRTCNMAYISTAHCATQVPSSGSEAPHQIVVGGMSKVHVRTSQSRFDFRCQSQTVAWIQLGVVERRFPLGSGLILMYDPQHEHKKDFLLGLGIFRPGARRKLMPVRHSLLAARIAQLASQGPRCCCPPKSWRP